jgi:dipeptidyl aminopeptidase/acylaminoacyl peptidase
MASPNTHLSKESKPLLIMHSDNDKSVPIANALTMVDALEKAGCKFKFHRYPEMGHMGINEEVIEKARAFIKEQSAE